MSTATSNHGQDSAAGVTRRDMLFIATGAVGVVGIGSVVWPLISSMSPDASTLALSSTEIDISKIELGQIVTVKWRGNPVFVRHRRRRRSRRRRTRHSPT